MMTLYFHTYYLEVSVSMATRDKWGISPSKEPENARVFILN